jgi:microsomal dipeptidase-like Zn-dependent dipeptidase
VPRTIDDLALARLARSRGVRAIVLKNHFVNTADRAALAMREVPGIEVFGGIVLNRAAGGLNAEAVRVTARMDGGRGKVVWLPTFDAENHVKHAKEDRPFVSVARDGRLVPELADVLKAAAEHDLVLATGHSSVEESLLVLDAARKAGVRRLLVTHAMADPINADAAQLRMLAATGALIECVYGAHLSGPGAPSAQGRAQKRVTVADTAKAIRAVGAEHFVVASDLGQVGNPLHPDGFAAFLEGLRAEGLSDREIDLVARSNAARLLGLQP